MINLILLLTAVWQVSQAYDVGLLLDQPIQQTAQEAKNAQQQLETLAKMKINDLKVVDPQMMALSVDSPTKRRLEILSARGQLAFDDLQQQPISVEKVVPGGLPPGVSVDDLLQQNNIPKIPLDQIPQGTGGLPPNLPPNLPQQLPAGLSAADLQSGNIPPSLAQQLPPGVSLADLQSGNIPPSLAQQLPPGVSAADLAGSKLSLADKLALLQKAKALSGGADFSLSFEECENTVAATPTQSQTTTSEQRCPEGWVHVDPYCYKNTEIKGTYFEARNVCMSEGARMPIIKDPAHFDAILAKGQELKMVWSWWVGANDIEQENVVVWEDGSLVNATIPYYTHPFFVTEPDDASSTGCSLCSDCFRAELGALYEWRDDICERKDPGWHIYCQMDVPAPQKEGSSSKEIEEPQTAVQTCERILDVKRLQISGTFEVTITLSLAGEIPGEPSFSDMMQIREQIIQLTKDTEILVELTSPISITVKCSSQAFQLLKRLAASGTLTINFQGIEIRVTFVQEAEEPAAAPSRRKPKKHGSKEVHVTRAQCEEIVMSTTQAPSTTSPKRCPEGWVHVEPYCYKNTEIYSTYEGAREICAAEGARLPIIKDPAHFDAIMAKRTELKMFWSWWVGTNDMAEENVFVWEDGSLLSATIPYETHPMIITEPDDLSSTGCTECADCFRAEMAAGFAWRDDICDRSDPGWHAYCQMDELSPEESSGGSGEETHTEEVMIKCEELLRLEVTVTLTLSVSISTSFSEKVTIQRQLMSILKDRNIKVEITSQNTVVITCSERTATMLKELMSEGTFTLTVNGKEITVTIEENREHNKSKENSKEKSKEKSKKHSRERSRESKKKYSSAECKEIVEATTQAPSTTSPQRCPEGWVHVEPYCYKNTEIKGTYFEARNVCMSEGARMPIIKDPAHFDAILAKGQELKMVWSWWVGANDIEQENVVVWEDGSLVNATIPYYTHPFFVTEPDDASSTGCSLCSDCFRAELGALYEWRDDICERKDPGWHIYCQMDEPAPKEEGSPEKEVSKEVIIECERVLREEKKTKHRARGPYEATATISVASSIAGGSRQTIMIRRQLIRITKDTRITVEITSETTITVSASSETVEKIKELIETGELKIEVNGKVVEIVEVETVVTEEETKGSSEKHEDKSTKDKSQKDKSENDKSKKDKSEKDKSEKDKSEKDKSEKDKSEKDKSKKDKSEKDKSEKDKSEKDKSEKDKSEKDKSEKDKSEKDKSKKDKSEKDKSEKDKSEKDKSKKDKSNENQDQEDEQHDENQDQEDEQHDETKTKKETKEEKKARKEELKKHYREQVEAQGGSLAAVGGCFSLEDFVLTPSGSKQLGSVKIGDEVMVADGHGGSSFQSIKWFLHHDVSEKAEFVRINLQETSILLTPQHLIPIVPCDLKSAWIIDVFHVYAQFSQRAKAGHCVIQYENGAAKILKIRSVERVWKHGYTAPITDAGTIVVNGVSASCYTGYENHRLQHAILRTFGWLRELYPTSDVETTGNTPVPLLFKWMETARQYFSLAGRK